MEKELSLIYKITTNDFDTYDKLKLSSITDFSQDIAGKHADILNVGFKDFINKDLIWVVVRNRFDILKSIKDLKEIKLKTYPLKNQFLEYPRDYEFYDNNDNLLIKGRSIWMIYSLKENKAVAPTLSIYEENKEGIYPNRIKRIEKPIINKDEYVKDIIIPFSKLDHNKHMNNTYPLDLYLDIFRPKEEEIIEYFQIEYCSQCFLDDLISIYKKEEGNIKTLYGVKDDILKFYLTIKIKEN